MLPMITLRGKDIMQVPPKNLIARVAEKALRRLILVGYSTFDVHHENGILCRFADRMDQWVAFTRGLLGTRALPFSCLQFLDSRLQCGVFCGEPLNVL